MEDQPVQILSATAAAERLGVSSSGLRRLGRIYAQVHGELPREPTTDNRIWTSEVIERLAQARALVEGDRYRSIKEALEALARGVDVDVAVELAVEAEAPTPQAIQVLMEQLGHLTRRLDTLDRVEEEVRALRRQLADSTRERDLEAQVVDLENRNRALWGEIERRRVAEEKPPSRGAWVRLLRRLLGRG